MEPVGDDEHHANVRSCRRGRDRPPSPASPDVALKALPVARRGGGGAWLGPLHALFPPPPPHPYLNPAAAHQCGLSGRLPLAYRCGGDGAPPVAGAPESPARTRGAARGHRNVDRRARAATRRHAPPSAATPRRPLSQPAGASAAAVAGADRGDPRLVLALMAVAAVIIVGAVGAAPRSLPPPPPPVGAWKFPCGGLLVVLSQQGRRDGGQRGWNQPGRHLRTVQHVGADPGRELHLCFDSPFLH